MKVGFVALGKLGLPVALATENKGHEVCGIDVNPDIKKYIEEKKIPYQEEGTPELLEKTKIKIFDTYNDVVKNSDLIFIAVQTPHSPKFEGITPLPNERKDFDYSYLISAVKSVNEACNEENKDIILSVISTVLPGTIEREIKPLLGRHIKFVYNPFLIAMGTTRSDFEDPEFVILGVDDPEARDVLIEFYKTIHDKKILETSIKNAELIKVIYNTFISSKLAFINNIAELCERLGANVDEISRALSFGSDRILSMKYMYGGMGDGGGCHPRDNIALSWLARETGMSYDYFEHIMIARERHIKWLARQIIRPIYKTSGLPVVLMGEAFKKNINLSIGSPAVFLAGELEKSLVPFEMYDPIIYQWQETPTKKAIYFISSNHDIFKNFKFPEGSIVIDPWGMIEEQEGVKLLKVGRGNG